MQIKLITIYVCHLHTAPCVCYFKQQKASLTSEAAFRKRGGGKEKRWSGWKQNDNEAMWGVRDYVTAEIETWKSRDCRAGVSACHFAAAWFCLCTIKFVLSPRAPPWQKDSMTRFLLALVLNSPFYFEHIKMSFQPVSVILCILFSLRQCNILWPPQLVLT